jgi:hypothetical protein
VQLALSTDCVLSRVSSIWIALSHYWPLANPFAAFALFLLHHWLMSKIGEFVVEHAWKFVKPLILIVMKKVTPLFVKLKLSSYYLAESNAKGSAV